MSKQDRVIEAVASVGSVGSVGSSVGLPAIVKLTADLAAYSTTGVLTDATGLSFAVASGSYYYVRFIVVFQVSAVTVNPEFTVNVPGFTVLAAGTRGPNSSAFDARGAFFGGNITAANDAVIANGTPAAAADYVELIEGLIVPSANGTLVARYAPSAAGNMTIRQGSCGLLWTIG